MKRFGIIGWLMLLMVACAKHPTADRMASSELARIDTLMQIQPDSALTLLLDEEMDDPYYQLLLSEALYKNDCAQTNRDELLEAMAYFDSVHDPFLSARCHYMNGVGYHEMDSVVPACEEYMKAIQTMEEHYTEKELVGLKAKYLALAYTKLTVLFSDQYLHEQAIYFGKQALHYYHKYDAEPWHVAWVLDEIGLNYDMVGRLDSAECYYNKALDILPDTNSITFRDITAAKILFSCNKHENLQSSIKQIYSLINQAESEEEYLSRCLTIGDIFYQEKNYDSAWHYLNIVYNGNDGIAPKKQAAELLVDICKLQGKSTELYAEYLVPFANQEENRSEIKSRLTELYQKCIQNNVERSYRNRIKDRTTIVLIVFGILIVVLSVVFARNHDNRKTKQELEIQITEERMAHSAKQKALGGRLKESNEALRRQKSEKDLLIKELEVFRSQTTWGSIDGFLNEKVCLKIQSTLEGKCIKRDVKSNDLCEFWLEEQELSELAIAVERHFNGFGKLLTSQYPKMSSSELNQCRLCLLNLTDVQIAALLHSDYSTIKKRSAKLKKAFGTEKSLQIFIRELVL